MKWLEGPYRPRRRQPELDGRVLAVISIGCFIVAGLVALAGLR